MQAARRLLKKYRRLRCERFVNSPLEVGRLRHSRAQRARTCLSHVRGRDPGADQGGRPPVGCQHAAVGVGHRSNRAYHLRGGRASGGARNQSRACGRKSCSGATSRRRRAARPEPGHGRPARPVARCRCRYGEGHPGCQNGGRAVRCSGRSSGSSRYRSCDPGAPPTSPGLRLSGGEAEVIEGAPGCSRRRSRRREPGRRSGAPGTLRGGAGFGPAHRRSPPGKAFSQYRRPGPGARHRSGDAVQASPPGHDSAMRFC